MKTNKHQLPKQILIGLVVLQVLILALTFFSNSRVETPTTDNDHSTFPFWLIVFISIIASRNKQRSQEKQQKFLWIIVGLASLMLIIMIFFLLKTIYY